MKPPCKDCPDRWVTAEGNCHTLCEKYRHFLAYNHGIQQQKRAEAVVHEYMILQKARNDKRRRRKKGEKK